MASRLSPRPSSVDSRSTTKLNGSTTNISLDEEETLPKSVIKKQKQWSVDASGVPHFLCILSKRNHLLFACDKYGSIDLYQLDGQDPSVAPRHLRQFELFLGNTNSSKPQIIEAFTVYTPFIVVSARSFR